jgi:hypothetical protein
MVELLSSIAVGRRQSHSCDCRSTGANPAKTPEKRAKVTFPSRVALAPYQRRESHTGRYTAASRSQNIFKRNTPLALRIAPEEIGATFQALAHPLL